MSIAVYIPTEVSGLNFFDTVNILWNNLLNSP